MDRKLQGWLKTLRNDRSKAGHSLAEIPHRMSVAKALETGESVCQLKWFWYIGVLFISDGAALAWCCKERAEPK